MWDSLESVYLKAKQDENCDAYCVPIPYYDLNPDHSFGQKHYEGREYPKNIEVIDWQTYRFEERKPDEIYIHNPYDKWNTVTSVHPRFYSSNLKKYTDKLVYIPYFILTEIEPDDQPAIDGMKHFIWTPGVINADKVIVQSEKMKQIYVNEYLKAAQANNMPAPHTDRTYLEQKILGLGSPKVDKVLNTKKEDIEIPPEWLKVIEKPDGTWKKIIFYNTGIASLLNNNDKWIEKIEDVLRVFKENQDDVALLWRPHPLIENTMRSMRPWILQKYMEIKAQYLREGWGIYDDTADMDRAVILSDAYYGDGSSVVQLYQKTGKPIMMQSMSLPQNDYKNLFLESYSAQCIDSALILFSEITNLCIVISLIDFTLVRSFSFDEEYRQELYATFSKIRDELFFVPYNAKKMWAINYKTWEKREINNIYSEEERAVNAKFILSVSYKNQLWLIGENIKKVIGYDVEKNYKFVEERMPKDILWWHEYVCLKNKIYIPSRNHNRMLIINVETKEIRVEKIIGGYEEGYTAIYIDDGNIAIAGKENTEIKIDENMQIICQRNISDTITDLNEVWHCEMYQGKKIMVPVYKEEIIIQENGEHILNIGNSMLGKNDMLVFQFVYKYKNQLLIQQRITGDIYALDMDTEELKKLNISNIDDSMLKEIRNRTIYANSMPSTENGFWTLEHLIDNMINRGNEKWK